jgi:hypothetical protein
MVKRDDRIITSVYLTKEMCSQIDKMADRGHISRNEQIRRYIEKGLAVEGYSQDIDLIAGIIRQEVQAVYHIEDIKAVVEQQANRIAKMHMKSGKVDAAAFFLLVKVLMNPFYKGAHLVCRTHQKGIRSNTYDIIPREEWEVLDGCHEAIVSPEDWEKVQELIDRRPPIMEGNACPFYNLFHGIIYCATCGKSMQVRYEKVGRTGKNRFTGEEREPIDKAYYICQTYNRLGKNSCTSHKVEARDLYNLVLKDIQELAAMALKDVESFYQRICSRMERRYLADASEMEKERERLEARNQEIDDMFLNLYTDKAKGILSEQRFVKLTAAMEREQEENQKQLKELTLSLRRSNEQENDVRTFIREIRQYATIQELDEGILNRLINRILVGEVKKIDGEKFQEIKIIYNFVGEIPAVTE